MYGGSRRESFVRNLNQSVTMLGKTVSHYRLLKILGEGGMGVVYEAEDIRLGRHVALKFVAEKVLDLPETVERFEREARAASLLNIRTSARSTMSEPGRVTTSSPWSCSRARPSRRSWRKARCRRSALPLPSIARVGRGAQPRDPPPRHQAGQHLRDVVGPGQDRGLRPRQVPAFSSPPSFCPPARNRKSPCLAT